MTRLRLFIHRLCGLFLKRKMERDLEDEIRAHLDMQIEDNLRLGMSPEEARYEALRKFGGVEQVKESYRDRSSLSFVGSTLQDLRYGLRMLWKDKGFAAIALFSLALGIGANAAIFQLLNAVRLRSLPVANPQELSEVRIAGGNHGFGVQTGVNSELTYTLWERIHQRQEAFSGLFAWGNANFNVGQGAEARRVRGLWVSGDLFPVLGVRPACGRLFTADDDRRGCGSAAGAVISYEFWQSYFGGEDSAIGKPLMVMGQPLTVIGVSPPEFFGLEVGKGFDVALPVCTAAGALDRLDYFWLVVMGRLKPGWTMTRASAHLNAISPGIFEETTPPGYSSSNNEFYRNFRLTALPAGQGVSRLRTSYGTSLWLLLGITGLVLLIACANLANLMLARASARDREIAVRVALGASRGRLIRQTLSESLLLAGSGAVLGAGLAQLMSRGLTSFLTTEGNILRLDLSSDWRVLAFTASVAVLTCIVFGIAPAIRASQIKPVAATRSGGRGLTNRERYSFQRFFVIGQIAISLALLVGALLFVRSFRNLITLDAGFRQNGILFVDTDFDRLRLPRERRVQFQTNLLEQIRSLPQVESAAISTCKPLAGPCWSLGVRVPGPQGEQEGGSRFTYVSPGYFKTMEIPVLAGRDFNDFDTETSRRVALVNQTFARRFFANRNPIGALARSVAEPDFPETLYEVIGVVKDTKYANLREDIPPITYVPAAQRPNPGPWAGIVVRSSAQLTEVISERLCH